MKYLEHRRHALRNKPFPHINKKGITVAQEVGRSMGEFDLVVTSQKPRAAETGVAMGQAITHESDFLHIEPNDIDSSLNWDYGFKEIVPALGLPRIQTFMERLKEETLAFLERLPDGKRILFLGHGGMIELHLLSLLDDHSGLIDEGALDKCEGWSLEFGRGQFSSPKILRI